MRYGSGRLFVESGSEPLCFESGMFTPFELTTWPVSMMEMSLNYFCRKGGSGGCNLESTSDGMLLVTQAF
jgi:hypothetical protein